MEQVTISIIIVNYNGKKFLHRLISSIYNQTYKEFEILLIDNSSRDGSVEYVKSRYRKVKIFVTENRGYPSACNTGARHAQGKYLMFFNEDMYIPDHFLKKMLDFRKELIRKKSEATIGAIGCKVIPFNADPSDFKNSHGGRLDYFGFPNESKNSEKAFVINCSPFFIQKKLFVRSGGFNKNIFLYGDGEDICWRYKLFGLNCFINNSIYLFHFGGGAIGKRRERQVAYILYGTFITIVTNYGIFSLCVIGPLYMVFLVILTIGITFLTKFNVRYCFEILRVYTQFFRDFGSIMAFRAFVQSHRIKKDAEMMGYFTLTPSVVLNVSYKRLLS